MFQLRTTRGSCVLSGFSQRRRGMAPLFFGILHDDTGPWTLSFATLGLADAALPVRREVPAGHSHSVR